MASLPRPLSKKLSSSSNGNAFSSKNAYDGVFDGPPKFGAPPPTFSSRIEDYAEIFGASRASSIPILDLSSLDDGGNSSSAAHDRRSKLDYSKIFGGFRDQDIAASYAQMFSKENGAQNSRRRPPDLTEGTLNNHAEGVLLREASTPEGKKQFNVSYHKTGPRDNTWENETTHVAELHAVPGFTCFFDGGHPIQTREGDRLESLPKEDTTFLPEEVAIGFSNNKASDDETVKFKSKFSSKESFVDEKSSNATDTSLKESSSDIFSSSSIPVDKVSYKREPKIPMDSYFKVPDVDTPKAAPDGCSTSYSDEDLDINSAAGASAAALKKALEKAEASIKFAREMMERKKDGSQKVSRSKSKSSLDGKKSKKDKLSEESSGARRNDVKDLSESSSVFLQTFSREKARKRGKVAPDFKETEFISKREGETNGNKVGSSKDCEGPQQIPETRNNVECTTATLASEHEGCKNNSVLSVESREIDREEIEAEKGTLEQLGLNGKDLDKEAVEQKDLKGELNAVKKAVRLEQHGFVVTTTEEFHSQQEYEYVVIPEEDSRSEDAKLSTGQDKCMKKLEVPTIEDNDPELHMRMKHNNEKCDDETQDCMVDERKFEDAREEQNDKRRLHEDEKGQSTIRLICEQDEIEGTRATSFDRIDSENVSESESSEQIHYDIHNVEGNQKGFDKIFELDISSKSLDGSPDEVDNGERQEGDSGLEGPEKIIVDDHAHIEGEVIHRKATCIEKPEVNMDDVRETTNEGHLSFEEDSLSDATHSCDTSDCEMGLDTDEKIHVPIPGNVVTTGGLVGTAVDQSENKNEMEEASEAVVSDFDLENNDFTETSFRTKETEQNHKKCEFGPNIISGHQTTVCEFGEDEHELKESIVACDLQNFRSCLDAARKQKERVQSGKETEASQPQPSCSFEVEEKTIRISEEVRSHIAAKNKETFGQTFTFEEKKTSKDAQKELKAEKEHLRRDDGANNRHREREKERMAVERAIREVRERAFAEARERAERAAVERATAEARQRVMAEAREKFEKTCAANKLSTEKATAEAKLRAERAAVERATSEARNRALEKALSQKATSGAREQINRSASDNFSSTSRDSGTRQNDFSSDAQKFEGLNGESAQRRKARLERHQRTMERAAKALAEKNMRDLLAQKEQAQRNRLADVLDADVRRWASGKEGNLRALLSTLQYILGPDSGWQPISLTEIIQTTAVKKAYRKATLHVHPDKLQQRGATIQQKYICEKVFDLLKAAWTRFNSEER